MSDTDLLDGNEIGELLYVRPFFFRLEFERDAHAVSLARRVISARTARSPAQIPWSTGIPNLRMARTISATGRSYSCDRSSRAFLISHETKMFSDLSCTGSDLIFAMPFPLNSDICCAQLWSAAR